MKRKNKISLFPDDRILYVKDPKHSTKNKKCPVITNKQIQQSCRIKNPYTKVNFISVHLYWTIWKEIMKQIPFTIILKRRKYLESHIIKEVRNLNTENYTEINEDINKWKSITCSWIERLNTIESTNHNCCCCCCKWPMIQCTPYQNSIFLFFQK